MSNQCPVRAASPQLRIRDRVDWVHEKVVDLATAIDRSSNPHGHVLRSAVPRPVNSPCKSPTWHNTNHEPYLAPPHVLSNRSRTVCHAELDSHPHVALPAPFEILPAHERAYDIDNCTSAGTPSIYAVVRKRSQQHSKVVGPTRRRVRRAEGSRTVMGPGFYGILESPDHPRPKSASLSLAPRFAGRGNTGVPDATYDSSEVPWVRRTDAHQTVCSVRSPIPRFFDPTAADAALIHTLPLPDGTRDDFAASVARSAIAYKQAFQSKAPKLDAKIGNGAVDSYLRGKLRLLSQPPGALQAGTIQGRLTDPRSLQVCATIRAKSPQRDDPKGSLPPDVAALLGPGRYHEGVTASAKTVRARPPGSIVLPLSNLPRFHEHVDGYKALSVGGILDDTVLAHRQKSAALAHYVNLEQGGGHRFAQEAEAVNMRTPSVAYRWDVPGAPNACLATVVRARSACAGKRPAPLRPPTAARQTIFTAIEDEAAEAAADLAASNNIADVSALPLPTLPVITVSSQRAVFAVPEPTRPTSTMQSRVGVLRSLSVPEAQAFQEQQRSERLSATQKRLQSKRIISPAKAPDKSKVPGGRGGSDDGLPPDSSRSANEAAAVAEVVAARPGFTSSLSSLSQGGQGGPPPSPTMRGGAVAGRGSSPPSAGFWAGAVPVSPLRISTAPETASRGMLHGESAKLLPEPLTGRAPRSPSPVRPLRTASLSVSTADREANRARIATQQIVDVMAGAEPSKYLSALGMSSIAELEAHQAEKTKQLRVGSPRRRQVRPASASRGNSCISGMSSPSSPAAESPLGPDMSLAAAGLRRASTPGSYAERRNSDIPEILRGVPGAVALAEGTYVHAGRVSSASSAVQERRRSVQHVISGPAEGEPGGTAADASDNAENREQSRRRSSATEVAAMLSTPASAEMGGGEGKLEDGGDD